MAAALPHAPGPLAARRRPGRGVTVQPVSAIEAASPAKAANDAARADTEGIGTSLWAATWALARRDLRVASRRRSDTLASLAFFLMVSSLFPLALGAEPTLLTRLAGGVLWVAALLASLLPMTRLFDDDLADGTLEQLQLSPHPLSILVLGKVAAHWLSTGALLTLAAPVVAIQYGLPAEALLALVASLLLGTPILSLLGAVAAALTAGLRGGALLLSLLVLPLVVPVLVFGCGAVDAVLAGQSPAAAYSLLGAGLLLALAGAPAACAAALRIAVEA